MWSYTIKLFILLVGLAFNYVPVQGKVKAWELYPTGLYIAVDVFRPFFSIWETQASNCITTGKHYELNGAFNIHRVILEGDYGWGALYRAYESDRGNTYCSTSGYYFRVGFNYNLLAHAIQKHIAFLGIRYGRGVFDFTLQSDRIHHGPWSMHSGLKSFRPPQAIAADWWELVGGCKFKLISLLYMGCTVRYKFGKKLYGEQHLRPFDILGWGLAEHKNCFGYNLYVTLRIPLYNDTERLIVQMSKNEKPISKTPFSPSPKKIIDM